MKILKSLKTQFLTLFLMGIMLPAFAQLGAPCTPPHLSVLILKNSNDIFEVYMTTDKAYPFPFNLFGQSSQLGITFPTGFNWPMGSVSTYLNITSNFGNGSWSFGDAEIAPMCGAPGTDYLYARLNQQAYLPLSAAGATILLFTFELPIGEPCMGNVALLENTDPFVVANPSCVSYATPTFFSMITGELPLGCNNFLGTINNIGIDCDLQNPQPVELLEFRATPKDQVCHLDWTTVTELNNKGFEVQRSNDGRNWKTIGWVDGNGSTDRPVVYKFIDKAPFFGTNYYRLEQFDYDGESEYSPIRTAEFKHGSKKTVLYPNPTFGEVTLQLPDFASGRLEIQVLDVNKQVVYEQIEDNNESFNHQINLDKLPAAVYLLKVRHVNGEDLIPFVIMGN